MDIGIVGLGRMGANIARRLMGADHRCVVFDLNTDAVKAVAADGARPASSLKDLVARLPEGRKAVWVMLPAGPVTEKVVLDLAEALGKGGIVVDGGNSYFKDSIRRGKRLAQKGVALLDCGTSGGVWGLERGYCLMIGGPKQAVDRLDPIFATLAPGIAAAEPTPGRDGGDPRPVNGYVHAGPTGSGHFVKMVHNGIEYGVMQSYAEGLDILANRNSPDLDGDERFDLNVADIAETWRRGSVISSWLLDLAADALARDGELGAFTGHVPDSGEGRWTVEAAIEEAVPADVLTTALYTRFRSRIGHTFAEKVLSAMRAGFGGHVENAQANINRAVISDD